ncbi:hypothetical protein BDV11DRAFT_173708 [Aspergillus similis]
MKNRPTHRDINPAGTLYAAVADEPWGSDEDSGTTAAAAELGPSQQDTERSAADLSDPEQAQRVAIAEQEAEDLLFDTPHTLEEISEGVIRSRARILPARTPPRQEIEDQEIEEVQEK